MATDAWSAVPSPASEKEAPRLPPIKKPVPLKPPLTDWPETYKNRRAQLKRGTVMLKSGRSIGYSDDCAHLSDISKAKVVICIHGMCHSKALWLLPKPLEGVRQISMDRLGYGSPSGDGAGAVKDDWLKPPSAHLLMDEQSLEYVEFLDRIGIDKCYVIGHSAGTLYGQALAMRLDKQNRLLGVALMGAIPYPLHKNLKGDVSWLATPHEAGTMKKTMDVARGMEKRGCCCFSTWHIVNMMSGTMVFKDKETKDPGFAGLFKEMRDPKKDGGAEARNAEMAQDHFMVATQLEAFLHGQKYSEIMMCDMFRMFGSDWGEELDTINAPMLVYNGEFDNPCPAKMLDFFAKAYPQVKTTVLEGHGHSTMFLELAKIMQALIEL